MPQHLFKPLLITLASALILCILFLSYHTYSTLSTLESTPTLEPLPRTGTLYLTYTPENTTTSQLFALNLETKESTPVPDTEHIYAYTVAKNGNTASSFNKPDGTSYIRIDSKDNSATAKETILTPSLPGSIQNLSWNTDGTRLAFEVVQSDEPTLSAGDVVIVVYDLNRQTETIIAQGVSPAFYDEGVIFYLTVNGLYSSTLNQELTYKQIISYDDPVSAQARIEFSPTKTEILVTRPEKPVVQFFKIKKEDSFTVVPGPYFDKTVSGMAAASNGRHIAFMSKVSEAETTVRLMDVALSTDEVLVTLPSASVPRATLTFGN